MSRHDRAPAAVLWHRAVTSVVVVLVSLVGYFYVRQDTQRDHSTSSVAACCARNDDRLRVLEQGAATVAQSADIVSLERTVDARLDAVELELAGLRSDIRAALSATGSVARSIGQLEHRRRDPIVAGGPPPSSAPDM